MSEEVSKRFPKNFYWGAATASYQVEGGIENTDWAKAAREGRVAPAGRLGDHYNLYKKDFDIAKELGHNCHRFSIEWARIEPEEGQFNKEEIEHYRNVLEALKERNIKPYVTLWHFTLPLWFSESGGFERKDSPELFARYCKFVTDELGDYCANFATLNEPEIFSSLGWIRGAWPPFKRFSLINLSSDVSKEHRASESTSSSSLWNFFNFLKVLRNLARAHNLAYKAIKSDKRELEVSVVKHVHVFTSNYNPLNILKAKLAHYFLNTYFLKKVYKNADYFGLNYYRYTKFGDKKQYPKSDMGWKLNPEHIYEALLFLSKYGKPIVVSEAGIADAKDTMRAEYITKQIEGVWKAVQDGADVRGYMYWSLLDNYEWDLGVDKKFGLVEIDYETLERKIRPSAYVYRDICLKNGLE